MLASSSLSPVRLELSPEMRISFSETQGARQSAEDLRSELEVVSKVHADRNKLQATLNLRRQPLVDVYAVERRAAE